MNVDQREDRQLDELLRQSYAELRQTKADQRQAVLDGLSDARRSANSPVRPSRHWLPWALTAACLIALFAVWSWRTTGPGNVAYGIDDVPQRLAEVQSLSLHGWMWMRWPWETKKPPIRLPIEIVLKRPGKFRATSSGVSFRNREPQIRQIVQLCDGQHEWLLDGDHKLQSSRPISALNALLNTETIAQSAAALDVLGPPDAAYRKVGTENDNGRRLDVYQARFQTGTNTTVARVWIDPKDGIPVRVMREETDASGKTSPAMELTEIAVNVPLADELFRFDGPKQAQPTGPAAPQPTTAPPVLDLAPSGSALNGSEKLEFWQALRISDNSALIIWWRSAPVAQTDAPDWLSNMTMVATSSGGDRALRHHWIYQSNAADRWNWSLVVPADGRSLGRGQIRFTLQAPRWVGTLHVMPLRLREDDLRRLLRAAHDAILPNNAPEISLPYLQAVARKLSSDKSSN
jgi:outer membrane lipoprotein-sorting protein